MPDDSSTRPRPHPVALDGRSDALLSVLRVALGLLFVTGGLKLAFSGDPIGLAADFTDPVDGFISPVYAAVITDTFGAPVEQFLRLQGVVEIALGTALIVGLFTPFAAAAVALLFVAFVVATPGPGEIILTRDLTLAAVAVAVAVAGPGRWSLDALRGNSTVNRLAERHDLVSMLLRYGLALSLLVSAAFTSGRFGNLLNSELPVVIPAVFGTAMLVGFAPRVVGAVVTAWMLWLFGSSLVSEGLLAGFDLAKRELGFAAAAALLAGVPGDRLTWPGGGTAAVRSGDLEQTGSDARSVAYLDR